MFRRDSSFLERRGPETIEDVTGWASNFATTLLETESASTLRENLQQGLLVTTDFSGYDAPRECLRVMLGALSTASGTQLPDAHVLRSCDFGVPQRKCLMAQSDMYDGGSSCVFCDLHDRLSEEHRNWISAASPTKGMLPQEAREANRNVANFLEQQRNTLFSLGSRSYCAQHNQMCPLHVLPAFRDLQKKQAKPDLAEKASPARKRRRQCCPWWQQPGSASLSTLCADKEPLVLNISGLVCTDYTPLGKKKGCSGSGLTEPTHAVWSAERTWLAVNSLEDVFFTENSSSYPVTTKQVDPLAATHDVKHVVVCPTELGFPMRRRRVFTVGIDRARWVWTGPSSAEEVQEDFLNVFGKSLEISGDVYACAPAEDIFAFSEERAGRRKTKLPKNFRDLPMREYLHCLLPPGAMCRLASYQKVRAERKGISGSFFADLDHNVDYGPSCGPLIPSLDTHPNIFSFQHSRLLLPAELLQAQGINMFLNEGEATVSPLASIFKDFSEVELRHFAGNSMHVPTFTAWMMYAFAHIRRIPEIGPLTPLLDAFVDELEESEQGGQKGSGC